MSEKKILLTGATGYIGGRLLSKLLQQGYHVRCLARRPQSLAGRKNKCLEVVCGDALDYESLVAALQGCNVAYYLIHSMGDNGDYEQQDRIAAENFAKAAQQVGIERIIYVGGLGDAEKGLSRHLKSRQLTGETLRKFHPCVVELRASIVIGSGSLSFEMIRSLVERLPVMVCPRWVRVKAQPIGIEDLLDYLVKSMEVSIQQSTVFDVGGPDAVSYGEIMMTYAQLRGLRRCMIPVPFLTPRLSSLWLGLVTPLYARVGRKLVDSLRNPTLVSNDRALRAFDVKPRSVSEAIKRALICEDCEFAETRWSDAISSSGKLVNWGGQQFGSRLIDSRAMDVSVDAQRAFAAVERIGGANGYYYANWLWSVRGFLDLLVGGIGVRRGRRHPTKLAVGDAVDFWRVEAIQPNEKLRLCAEMKVPGRAWLEFEVTPLANGSRIRQTAIFDPLGLFGLLYWYSIWPLHQLVFRGMLKNLARWAESQAN